MLLHTELGTTREKRQKKLAGLIRRGAISLGGYSKGKIYGLLRCKPGKRMRIENRVFFKDEKEPIQYGYRPCAHCLPEKYKLWKAQV